MIMISEIQTDERCQPRVTLDPELIDDYANAMTDGARFPPLTVYSDGGGYYLADGFHRLYAAKKTGLTTIDCEVRPGDIRAAMLHAVGANSAHGLRRSNLDKRKAVETLLTDDEWRQWSDREIARRCAVDNSFVSRMRASLLTNNSDADSPERTYTDRWGNMSTMQTGTIGRRTGVSVDRDTGEIMDDGDDPEVASEEVDPTDPASFALDPRPQQQISAPSINVHAIATDLIRRLGEATARAVADEIYTQTATGTRTCRYQESSHARTIA
ncbi:MAG: ParB N-terminal domain-containing protein [Chloroflexia bacterium]|nr:ParB N-terminal domain-containing protein [Chloroflexia bacterium]